MSEPIDYDELAAAGDDARKRKREDAMFPPRDAAPRAVSHDAPAPPGADVGVQTQPAVAAPPTPLEKEPVRVLKVTYDAATLVLPEAAKDTLWEYFMDWDYKDVKLEMTTMPRAEFDALGEFEGF